MTESKPREAESRSVSGCHIVNLYLSKVTDPREEDVCFTLFRQ